MDDLVGRDQARLDSVRLHSQAENELSGPSTGWRPEGVRKIDRCNFFFIGAEPRVVNHEIDQAGTEKKPKTFLVHRNEPGCSPIDRMQSGPSTGWRPEGVRKIDRCNFFFIGAEPRVVNHEIDQAGTEKKTQNIPGSPERTRMQSNRPDAVRTIDRMASGRCPENRSVQFFFIGAEPRVVNHEIDQAETEKKTQNIPGSPDRTRMQSNRPDAVRTIDRMASGRCPENRSVQYFFHRGRTSSNEP